MRDGCLCNYCVQGACTRHKKVLNSTDPTLWRVDCIKLSVNRSFSPFLLMRFWYLSNSLNMYTQLSETRDPNFGLSLFPYPFSVYSSSECFDKTCVSAGSSEHSLVTYAISTKNPELAYFLYKFLYFLSLFSLRHNRDFLYLNREPLVTNMEETLKHVHILQTE